MKILSRDESSFLYGFIFGIIGLLIVILIWVMISIEYNKEPIIIENNNTKFITKTIYQCGNERIQRAIMFEEWSCLYSNKSEFHTPVYMCNSAGIIVEEGS